jgi:hypothetical protein
MKRCPFSSKNCALGDCDAWVSDQQGCALILAAHRLLAGVTVRREPASLERVRDTMPPVVTKEA